MKLVHGDQVHELGWRDGCFAGGAVLFVGGMSVAFGWGVLAAMIGVVLMLAPFLKVSGTAAVPSESKGEG